MKMDGLLFWPETEILSGDLEMSAACGNMFAAAANSFATIFLLAQLSAMLLIMKWKVTIFIRVVTL